MAAARGEALHHGDALPDALIGIPEKEERKKIGYEYAEEIKHAGGDDLSNRLYFANTENPLVALKKRIKKRRCPNAITSQLL